MFFFFLKKKKTWSEWGRTEDKTSDSERIWRIGFNIRSLFCSKNWRASPGTAWSTTRDPLTPLHTLRAPQPLPKSCLLAGDRCPISGDTGCDQRMHTSLIGVQRNSQALDAGDTSLRRLGCEPRPFLRLGRPRCGLTRFALQRIGSIVAQSPFGATSNRFVRLADVLDSTASLNRGCPYPRGALGTRTMCFTPSQFGRPCSPQ